MQDLVVGLVAIAAGALFCFEPTEGEATERSASEARATRGA